MRDKTAMRSAWLSRHPNRTLEWLEGMISQGFDLHHVDGDRDNNDPENLVLIETNDHMMVHGLGFSDCISARNIAAKKALERRQKAYELAITGDYTWSEIAELVGWKNKSSTSTTVRRFARDEGLPLPNVKPEPKKAKPKAKPKAEAKAEPEKVYNPNNPYNLPGVIPQEDLPAYEKWYHSSTGYYWRIR